MLSEIVHRGPDGLNAYVDVGAGIAMGHVRLAINDLGPTGTQPLESVDTQLIVTVSGEIYGFKAQRAELAARGEAFRSKSDSEIILALYRRHGLDFVNYLRGDFAIALFDRSRNRLVLVRDRFGVRPLFVYQNERVVAWGSEVKALLAHPAVPRRLSRPDAVNQLVQVMVPGTSAFEGVRSLKPGQLIVVDRNERALTTRDVQYWDLEFPVEGDYEHCNDPEPHIKRVRDAVIESLVLRMEADVPVAFYLSGGLDSSGLLGLAAQSMQSAPRAFTIGFADSSYDESALAAAVAQYSKADLVTVPIGGDDLSAEWFQQAVWHCERTFYNSLGIAKMHLSRHVAKAGVRAVISGEGADELFAGYPFFQLDRGELDEIGRSDARDELMVGAILPAQTERHPGFEAKCGFTPGWIHTWISAWRRVRPLLDDGLKKELSGYDPIAAVADSLDDKMIQGRSRLDISQYSWIKTMLDGQILSWGGDRVDMANAVESRPVFLDHDVAAAAAAVPPKFRIRSGREKWILREALRGVLPDDVYQRRKFAFMAPPAHRSEQGVALLKEMIDMHLSRDQIAAVGICDPDRTSLFLREALQPTSQANANEADKICSHLLGLHLIHEQFIR
jgi:asparagine synthase (glutamine-hydrolysing)